MFIFQISFLIVVFRKTTCIKITDNDYNFPTILLNNLKVVLLMLAGSITFGLSTFINLLFNGFNVGVLIGSTFLTNEPLKLITALILPHGIFEIPAMIISAIAGFKIPYEVVQYLRDKLDENLRFSLLACYASEKKNLLPRRKI